MKTFILLIFSATFFSGLGAANLVTQNFSGSLPVDWYSDPATTIWSYSATPYAGGSAGELSFNYVTPGSTGLKRYVSPAIDTRKVHNMSLSFRHMLDDYEVNSNLYTLGAAISSDNGASWTNVWSITTSSDIAATQVTVNPISYTLGRSANTRICFFFSGDTYNIDHWYIDDIVLSYQNTLGDGTWLAGDYTPVGNVIVPNGYTFQLDAGTTLRFTAGSGLDVDGKLLVNGYEGQYVVFTSAAGAFDWNGLDLIDIDTSNDSTLINFAFVQFSNSSGIYVYNTDKVRISDSYLYLNRETAGAGGGGIYLYNSDIVIDNCRFNANSGSLDGLSICSLAGSPVITNNKIHYSSSVNPVSSLFIYGGSVNGVMYNNITNNQPLSSGYAVHLYNVSGQFRRNLIVNNDCYGLKVQGGTVSLWNCDIINNEGYGIWINSEKYMYNMIIYGNTGAEIYNSVSLGDIHLIYSCIQGMEILGMGYFPAYCYQNITSDPLFIDPTTESGSAGDGLAANWNLRYDSPCLDSGYFTGLDPDGSNPDRGAYTRHLKPVITKAQDVPNDQGHRLDLRWNNSDEDVVYTPNDYYQIWYWDWESLRTDAVFVSQPAEVTPELVALGRAISWRDGERTWCYLNQVPANNFTDYRFIVETLQDSSSTGTHAVEYMVIYDNNNYGAWSSNWVWGYTVDNIPPYAPSRLDISKTGTGTYNLTWDEVTGGYLNGNFEEEINAITYKVYSGDTCDFIPGPANFLLSTTDPYAVLLNQTADHKFYKITASDSE